MHPEPEDAEDLQLLQTRETELAARMEQYTGELAELRQRQSRVAGMLSEMPALCRELERWTAAEADRREQAKVLDGAMEYLEHARDNLRTGFLGPLRSRLVRYLAQITGESPENLVVTPEMEISLMRGGAAREIGYFSAGQADAVMLCMRFALVDALFAGEQPFVILDDPFVNLDDAHVAQALAVLQKLGQEKQILYMTCNTSRIPE